MKIALLLALVAAPVMADEIQMPVTQPLLPATTYASDPSMYAAPPAPVTSMAMPPSTYNTARDIKFDNSHYELSPQTNCITTYSSDIGYVTSCQ